MKAAQKLSNTNIQNPPRSADVFLFLFLASFQSIDDPEVIKPLLVEATGEPEV